MVQGARRTAASDWLTVDEIATELRISKSIVYRLIRGGELEAINIADTAGRIAQKGHYRVKRLSLDKYLESKRVKPPPNKSHHSHRTRQLPQVKNHLGI